MAFLMAMRRSTSLFTKLTTHNSNPNPNRFASSAVASLSSRRPYSSSIPIIDSSEETGIINFHGGSFTRSYTFTVQRGICDEYMDNPFRLSGPQGAYEVKKVEGGLFVRMEMPGIEKEDVKLWVEYGNVFIKGEGKKESKHEESGKTYGASIELPSNSFQAGEIKAEMKNGVLRMMIPKTKSFEATSGLSEIKIK